MTLEESKLRDLIERLDDIADQLDHTPNCEWADDVREAAQTIAIILITKKFKKS